MTPDEALDEAQRLLDTASPFQAHEVLEAAWKSAPDAERELWRGLAQIAVGLTHARRGNATGARALLSRGADRVAAYAPDAPHRIDAAAIAAWAHALAGRLTDGTDTARPADLTLRLTRL